MGKILKTKKFTTAFEGIMVALMLAVILGGVYYLAPGLRVDDSVVAEAMKNNHDNIDNVDVEEMRDLPSLKASTDVLSQPRVRIAGYAWNGETPIITANGGPFTTKGSLMEQNGVNLQIIRQDWLSELATMQMNFIKEYDKGEKYPSSDKSAFGIMIMGDGAPYYISTTQNALNQKFPDGNGGSKYHVEVVGAFGMSDGEDKLIGPREWKTDPQSMKGSLISCVIGDGDWVVALNWCFANNLPVNPSLTTYDPNAVNFFSSKDDDYINSAKELIASQTADFTVELDEVIDGKLTGKKVKKKIDGCATWTPGDKMVFDALGANGFTDIASTREFKNQMPTTLIVVKEWAKENPAIVSNILKSAYVASNQIKQYDQWAKRGSEAVHKTFNAESPEYWYNMFKGQTGSANGNSFNMGGTRVLTYRDALQYYGITDGVNRYKSVYNQVSNYIVKMNPMDFNTAVTNGVVPYNEAVNLNYLKTITFDSDNDGGVLETVDYSTTKTSVMASGDFQIKFATGSANIQSSSNSDLNSIYNLLIQAEGTKVRVIGHTDNTGSDAVNTPLSKKRANSVVDYLISRGISRDRIQEVDGKGSSTPVANNNTASGRAQNRRVQVTFLK